MAAWSDDQPQPQPLRWSAEDGTSLETLTVDAGERSRQISYLLPIGERRTVTIDVAHDAPEIRAAIGDALASGRTGIGRKGRR